MEVHQSSRILDFDDALALVRRWPSHVARRWTREFLARFCEDSRILAVVVYGSAVRNVSDSADVDLLFIYEDTFPDVSAPPFDVDLRGYDRASVEAQLCRGHDLLGWAVRYGLVLCERAGYWTDLVSRWREHLSLPDPQISEDRASKAQRLRVDLLRMGDLPAANEQYLAYLTHTARAKLLRRGIFPGSRPELPEQLRELGEPQLADELVSAMVGRE